MSNESIPKKVVIVGDLVTDVVFPNENPMSIALAKEAIASLGEIPDQSVVMGVGGGSYLQQAIDVLFATYYPDAVNGNGEVDVEKRSEGRRLKSSLVFSQIEEAIDEWIPKKEDRTNTIKGGVNYWTLAERPSSMSKSSGSVYRAVGKQGGRDSGQYLKWQERLPEDSELDWDEEKQIPDFLVIADYDREVRRFEHWSLTRSHWLVEKGHQVDGEVLPRRVILLGNRLPSKIVDGKEGDKEFLWKEILEKSNHEARESTIIVTSMDRLRQEGANISKRLSWDDTIASFQRELEYFEPLKKLASFGHLIIRVGVVGAIYCYHVKNKNSPNGFDIKMRVILDPNADQLVFRDRLLQGNAFGIRPIIPACLAYRIVARLEGFEGHVCRDEATVVGLITGAVRDAIGIAQEVYRDGFGGKRSKAKQFIERLDIRRKMTIKSYAKAREKKLNRILETRGERVEGEVGQFIHYVDIPRLVSENTLVDQWSLLTNHLRAGISEHRVLSASRSKAKTKEKLYDVEMFRKIRLARAIVFFGLDEVVNCFNPDLNKLPDLTRRSSSSYLDRVFKSESKFDKEFRSVLIGEVAKQSELLTHCLLPENLEEGKLSDYFGVRSMCAFSFAIPVAVFGNLKILGRIDGEEFSSIRNLFSNHLSGAGGRPVSIAVFGPPGSGKSFGVTSLAKTMAGDDIEEYTCNLSQLEERRDLDREFFKVTEIISRGKTPLVFFDEFDSDNLHWLKYFLVPMQDGIYVHPDGELKLKNSIFVFAGGVYESFEKFYEEAGDAKDVKGPDFLSRINGFIDIGGVNRREKDQDGDEKPVSVPKRANPKTVVEPLPYLRRALILRSEIERDGNLLDQIGVAQIDRNIVDALLRVEKYKHGARSMGAVLRTCSRWNHRIEKASLPKVNQLEMHVDAKSFVELVIDPENHPLT